LKPEHSAAPVDHLPSAGTAAAGRSFPPEIRPQAGTEELPETDHILAQTTLNNKKFQKKTASLQSCSRLSPFRWGKVIFDQPEST
jgi:hypothetical protein